MDLKKTGEFISSCRKEKGLTQEKLADKLFISEKTVSKWECGKGFPDTSLLLPLCEALDITTNELLCGEHLSEKEYKQSAEENLLALKSAHEKSTKHLLALEYVVETLGTIAFFLSIFSASYFVENLAWKIVLICTGMTSFFVSIGFCFHIERNVGFYECGHCHHKFIPSYGAVFWSAHCGRTRFMKCPKCQKRSWCKKRISD